MTGTEDVENVVPMPFASSAKISADDIAKVRRLGRRAAALLGCHLGTEIRLRFRRDGAVAYAFAMDPYRLGIVVGYYGKDSLGERVGIDVLAEVEWLYDGSLATSGDFAGEYANPEFGTVESAATWIRRHVRPQPEPREDTPVWKTKTVQSLDTSVKVDMPLVEAVKIYGPIYRHKPRTEIVAQRFVRTHGLVWESAKLVTEALRRMLPWKWLLYRIESFCEGTWHVESACSSIEEIRADNRGDVEVEEGILPELARLEVGEWYTYDGGAGGITRYTRVEEG